MNETIYQAHKIFNKHTWKHFDTSYADHIVYCTGCGIFGLNARGRIRETFPNDKPISPNSEGAKHSISYLKELNLSKEFISFLVFKCEISHKKKAIKRYRQWIRKLQEA